MPKKKKQFINKREALHFNVVHRSQEDPAIADENASDLILKPIIASGNLKGKTKAEELLRIATQIPETFEQADLVKAQDRVDNPEEYAEEEAADEERTRNRNKRGKGRAIDVDAEYDKQKYEIGHLGLPDDGYDYSQHLKQFAGKEGGGIYIGSEGGPPGEAAPMLDETLFATNEDERLGFMSQKDAGGGLRMGVDLEVMAALDFPSDDEAETAGGFEALDDDFVFQADGSDVDDDEGSGDSMGAGPSGAAARARQVDFEDGEYSSDFDDDHDGPDSRSQRHGGKQLRRHDYFAETERRSVVGTSIASSRRDHLAPRFFDEHFDHVLDRYDDDEDVLDADPDDPRIDGTFVAEDHIDHLLDEFLTKHGHQGEIEGDEHWHNNNATADTKAYLRRHPDVLTTGQPGKILEMGAPRAATKTWDCESILSTYSNVDNHPTRIREESKRKKKTKVVLNARGLPQEFEDERRAAALTRHGAADGNSDDSEGEEGEDEIPVNKGVARNKKEDKAAKKARKAAVKAERAANRQRKKQLKNEYRSEGIRQGQIDVARRNNINGVKM